MRSHINVFVLRTQEDESQPLRYTKLSAGVKVQALKTVKSCILNGGGFIHELKTLKMVIAKLPSGCYRKKTDFFIFYISSSWSRHGGGD